MKVRVFTDGACSENPGPGGWAAVFNTSNKCSTIKGHEEKTTNNRMELMAVIKSLKKILKMRMAANIEFELYSDSAYVINAINNGWVNKWQANNWKTTKQDDIKNRDLWEKFIILRKAAEDSQIHIKFIKIKGHAGNTFNEIVDKLAKEEAQTAKENLQKRGNSV